MNTRDAGKRLLYLYQRSFWYIAQAKNEALKPLGFWNESILLLTFLKVSDVSPSFGQIVIAYIFVMLVGAVIGKIIVSTGIVRYNAKIANHQNDELMEILEAVGRIERKLDQKSISSNDGTSHI